MGTASTLFYVIRLNRSTGAFIKGYKGDNDENLVTRHHSAFEYADHLYLGFQDPNDNYRAYFMGF